LERKRRQKPWSNTLLSLSLEDFSLSFNPTTSGTFFSFLLILLSVLSTRLIYCLRQGMLSPLRIEREKSGLEEDQWLAAPASDLDPAEILPSIYAFVGDTNDPTARIV
jgi:hypothetical protein